MFLNLEQEFGNNSKLPLDHEVVWWAFWDKGISYEQVEALPLPYIFSILKVNQYVTEQQEKEMKKNRK